MGPECAGLGLGWDGYVEVVGDVGAEFFELVLYVVEVVELGVVAGGGGLGVVVFDAGL